MFRSIVASLVVVALLSACTSYAGQSLPNFTVLNPQSLRTLRPAAAIPIQHVIVVIQENRTVDNLFNGFPGADTVPTGLDHAGKKVTLQPEGLEWEYDPSHTHANLEKEYDGGKMDAFDLDKCDADPLNLTGGCSPPKDFTYSYVPKSETTWYWLLAGEYDFAGKGYGFADHLFSSRQVPSFPGHQYLVAGQTVASDDPIGPGENTLGAFWGCDAPAGARVYEFGSKYSSPLHKGRPCYDYRSIADLLDAKGVSWKYYTGAVGTDDGTVSAFDAIKHVRYGADWSAKVITPMTDILSDIANGTLPQVAFVTPPFPATDHGATLSAGGPAWVMSLYVALTENPTLYNSTTMFVTWDDSGGWYDHVAPPSDSFGPLGFRVPPIAVSPYARQKVSHKTHTFGSILHYIEDNWDLGSLHQEDASSDNLADMFDYHQKPIPPIANWGTYNRTAFEREYPLSYWQAAARDPRPIDTDR